MEILLFSFIIIQSIIIYYVYNYGKKTKSMEEKEYINISLIVSISLAVATILSFIRIITL